MEKYNRYDAKYKILHKITLQNDNDQSCLKKNMK